LKFILYYIPPLIVFIFLGTNYFYF
jgi:hypothetical protein